MNVENDVEEQDCEMKEVKTNTDYGVQLLHNTKGVLTKIANLYAERLTSDVILVVGEKQYAVHRIILCASSDVFDVMLMNGSWREFNDNVVNLQEEERCQLVFPQFLRYMYHGEINVSVDTAVYILKLADKYNIRDMAQLCVDYMKKHITKATVKGYFVEWLHNSLLISSQRKHLATLLENFLKWNLEFVLSYSGWEHLNQGVMQWLVQQNDLAIRSEYRLYEMVEGWFLYQKALIESRTDLHRAKKEDAIRSMVYSVLIHIRYPMMSLIEMANVLMNPCTQFMKEFFVARVADGMNFHSERLDIVNAVCQTEAGEHQFTPRLYTADFWSLQIACNFFEKMEKYSSVASVFFSPKTFIDNDEQSDAWDVEFYPLGVRYKPAQLIGVYSAATNQEIPESIIRTVRLRITNQEPTNEERRYMIGVLIAGIQNDIEYVHNCRVRIAYFSSDQRVVNIDNLVPFDDLQLCGVHTPSLYMVGERRDTLKIHVIIVPLNQHSNVFNPTME
ncbi:BTB/POZ domain-containing protein 17 [Anopheles bellator]|uniref:BTB/POZ domain-containing protein 17 n=1 Tax=Anopheles bellator TaxID=139047 RepID=UPI00264A112C|nr:BTB/POZ domain-containing protein 17 [Anopheles bellator]XP_058064184.1 BTB/POZ domain-containing protein 17 [Anopheles bellator]